MELQGKTALITGGNSGIGLAAARLMLAQGARVAITGRDRAKLDEAATELGGDVLALQADLNNSDDLAAVAAAVGKTFGTLDIVFANAVVFLASPRASGMTAAEIVVDGGTTGAPSGGAIFRG